MNLNLLKHLLKQIEYLLNIIKKMKKYIEFIKESENIDYSKSLIYQYFLRFPSIKSLIGNYDFKTSYVEETRNSPYTIILQGKYELKDFQKLHYKNIWIDYLEREKIEFENPHVAFEDGFIYFSFYKK